jgi:hypothetical protein
MSATAIGNAVASLENRLGVRSPPTEAVFGDESISPSKLGVDPRSRPLDPGQDQFRHGIAVALDHHHVAVTAHTAISQEPEIGLGAILVQPVANSHVEMAPPLTGSSLIPDPPTEG